MDGTALKAIIAVILIGASFVEVPKVKLNLWGLIGSALRKGLVGSIEEKVTLIQMEIQRLDNSISVIESQEERREAIRDRQRILRFGDELVHQPDLKHTQEHWAQIVEDTKRYAQYCDKHPEFLNGKTEHTSKLILDTYDEKLRKGDF